jgi:hypothetical protein
VTTLDNVLAFLSQQNSVVTCRVGECVTATPWRFG